MAVSSISQVGSNPTWTTLTVESGITTPSTDGDGVLRCMRIGKHVFMRGSILAAIASGTNKLISTLPTEFRPSGVIHWYPGCGGQNLSRAFVHTDGSITIEWNLKLSNGSAFTSQTWFDFNFDYWID